MSQVRPVVLSGGSGTRLWPLSTPAMPKQFAPLFDGRSLFGLTLERLVGIENLLDAIVVTGSAHRDLAGEEMERSAIGTHAIITEPTGRNTAPAAIAAALVSRPDDVLVILPADHLITDRDAFRNAVRAAVDLADSGHIVTFGVVPDRPETGYGYIEVGAPVGPGYAVARFKEKPDLDMAGVWSTDGSHLWNSGMFVATAELLLSEAREHCPGVVEGVAACVPTHTEGSFDLAAEFAQVESISIDYAIMEHTDKAAVLPLQAGWNDVGSYLSLLAASERDENGNHVSGNVTVRDVTGSFVRATSRRLVVAGIEAMVVVETPDAVLVLPLERSQQVKELQQESDD